MHHRPHAFVHPAPRSRGIHVDGSLPEVNPMLRENWFLCPTLPHPELTQKWPGRWLRGLIGLSAGPTRGPSQARPESAPCSGPSQAHSQGQGPDEETRWVYSSWSAAARGGQCSSQKATDGRTLLTWPGRCFPLGPSLFY